MNPSQENKNPASDPLSEVTPVELEKYFEKIKKDAEASGYFLNPDTEFTKEILRGCLVNIKRYGYPACPCRIAAGKKEKDLDIICPCDYRDRDLQEYGTCYCALYVSKDIATGQKKVEPIPERRPPELQNISFRKQTAGELSMNNTGVKKHQESPAAEKKESVTCEKNGMKLYYTLPYPVFRCRVCGYLCAREEPPEVCPVCKVSKERFERFM